MAGKKLTNKQIEERKDHAKTLYVKDGVSSQKELAERVGITEKTIGKWIKEENWDKYKKNFVLTRQEQMGNLLDELVEINKSIREKAEGQRFADSKLGDVRRKLIKDIKELETKSSKPEAITACIALLDFVRKVDLKVAQELAPFVDGFIKSLL